MLFVSRAAAMALAPSGPMQLPQRLIQVSVVFFKRLSKSYGALITYMTGMARLIEVSVLFVSRALAIAMAP